MLFVGEFVQRIERSNRIRRLGVALAVMLGTSIACLAQEVGFIDLTQVVARTELRYPPPRSDEVTNRRGGNSIVDGRHDDCDIPNAPKHAGALRTTLVWLDRDEYAVGDQPKFEVRIENVGSVPVEMPFSPHLADLQPADPTGYTVMLTCWLGLARDRLGRIRSSRGMYGDCFDCASMFCPVSVRRFSRARLERVGR